MADANIRSPGVLVMGTGQLVSLPIILAGATLVERVLAQLPTVERSAVVGVPGGPSGEQVWAFVTVVAGSTCTTGEVLAHCRDHLARYKVPDHICIRPALPMTKDGKVQKFLLNAEVRAGPAGPL